MAEAWYVAQLLPLASWNWLPVVAQLDRLHFQAYVPVETVRWHAAGIIIQTEEPLFRGYVFTPIDFEDGTKAWGKINHVTGIRGLLPLHDRANPVPLPQGFIEELQARPVLRRDKAAEIALKFAKDETVRILRGLLVGETGTVLSSTLTSTWVKHHALGKVRVPTANVGRV